jgi:hypothetical protein
MKHSDLIKLVSNNPNKLESVYEDLLNLEASCDLIADSEPDQLTFNVDLMISSLLKFKTSKFELLADSFSNNPNQQELFPPQSDSPGFN